MSQVREIPFGRPWITDEDKRVVQEVLGVPVLTHGPQGKGFEEEFAAFAGPGAHAVAVSSCMAALHLAYLNLGVGPGDEVIVPSQTHTATVHAVELVGAKPVFADCDPATGNMTAAGIVPLITPRTKAIGVVHFLGIPCDMPSIMGVADQHRLKVVEDCALALGTRFRGTHVGLFGQAGCFSFYPVKHITTGEGGMLLTRDGAFAKAAGQKRGFGVDRTLSVKGVPGTYDVTEVGLNYRMSEMQAALGRSQLKRIEENLSRRKANFETIRGLLEGVKGVRLLDAVQPDARSSHYCAVAVLEESKAAKRNEAIARLNAQGIGTSVYYPHPVPRLKVYQAKYATPARTYAEASRVSDAGIALPVGVHLTTGDAEHVAKTLIGILREI